MSFLTRCALKWRALSLECLIHFCLKVNWNERNFALKVWDFCRVLTRHLRCSLQLFWACTQFVILWKRGMKLGLLEWKVLSAITRVIRIESHDLEFKWSAIEINNYSYCEFKFPSSWVLCGHMNMMALIKCVYCGDHMRSLLCCWKERLAEQLRNQNGISFPTISFPHPLF